MDTLARRVRVPFLDLARTNESLRDALARDFLELIGSSAFVNGPAVAEFERAWAVYCTTTHCVGVASGLDGLRLGLLAAGVERGDEVIVPAATFAATFESVAQAGAVPVPVDASRADYNLDPAAVEAAITPRTRFVMPVHLYGQLADGVRLQKLAAAADVAIVEDACQAHGATRDGLSAGTIGIAAAFSFYPGKNLGAMGDAGALVTDDGDVADRARALREHGQRAKYRHEFEGYTARLDTIQALVLLRKLELLDDWNAERATIATFYNEALKGVGDLALPPVANGSQPVWHLYVVMTRQPEALADYLRTNDISTGRHYPEPPHLSQAYAHLGHKPGAFPVAEELSLQSLSLPIFPGMEPGEAEAVVAAICRYFERG